MRLAMRLRPLKRAPAFGDRKRIQRKHYGGDNNGEVDAAMAIHGAVFHN